VVHQETAVSARGFSPPDTAVGDQFQIGLAENACSVPHLECYDSFQPVGHAGTSIKAKGRKQCPESNPCTEEQRSWFWAL